MGPVCTSAKEYCTHNRFTRKYGEGQN